MAKPNRRGAVAIAALALSAFGPYVVSGFRTEQIAVYGAVIVLAAGAAFTRARPSRTGILVVGLLAAELTIAAIGAADPPQNTTKYTTGSAVAGIDNLALPIAAIGIVWMLLAMDADRRRLLRIVGSVTVCAMTVNAGLAIAAAAGSGPDLAGFQTLATGESVAYRAEQLGRFSGIFNQPAEAGLMYSLALLCAVYLLRGRAVLLALTGSALTIGGILSVSKVFLLVGLPIGAWHILRSSGGRERRIAALLAAAAAVWAAVRSGLVPPWIGADYILRLLPGGNQDAVGLYTAGRLSDGSTLTLVAGDILHSSPIWGLGAGGLRAPYDSGWVEALAVAGLAGAALFTATLAVLAVAAFRRRRIGDGEHRLAEGVVAVVIGAAVGVPSLTANRCATVVWLLLALLLLSARRPALDEPVGAVGDAQRVNQFVPLV